MTLDSADRATLQSSGGAPRASAMPSVAPGQVVARFRLLRPLGKGAMGVVYLAHDPELDRNVALKFLRSVSGRSADRRRDRMLREAQAMARLCHPNVVGVLDVGLHGDADPSKPLVFIAMEYVNAESLTAWLRRERSPAEILRVFMAAGRGLAAAHAAGLVHRDFKPDNVLVGDGEGHDAVKVTDFGLACASGSTQGSAGPSPAEDDARGSEPRASGEAPSGGLQALSQGLLTRTGAATGTPAYMAPEQHRRQTVDERADQFAFCVALYEALWGQAPFEGSDAEQRAKSVMAGHVLAPPRRPGVPSRVWPIVRRGLQRRSADRWPSMNALLEALDAAAARRWRRWAVVGGAVVTAGGGLAAAGLFAPPRRCPAAEGELAGVWDEARKASTRTAMARTSTHHAEETWARLSAMLDAYAVSWHEVYRQVCDPARPVDEVSTTHDRAMACLAERKSRLEALVDLLDEADRQTVDGAVRAASGLPAVQPCADAEALSAEVSPPTDEPTQARVRAIRADLGSADTLLELGRAREAVTTLERAAAAADRTDYPPIVAETLVRLGSAVASIGDAKRGRSLLERAYFIATESSDTLTATRAAIALARITGIYLREAEPGLEWARHAQAGLARLHDDGTLEGSLLTVIGQIHHDKADLVEARKHHERSLAIAERVYGVEHLQTAKTLNNMGVFLFKIGEYEVAGDYLARGLEAHEKALGPSHPTVGAISANIGLLLRKQGDVVLARARLERAIDVLEKAHGPDHFELAVPLNNIALVYQQEGDLEATLRTLERALAITRQAHGDEHPMVALLLSNVAFAHLGTGDSVAAETSARRAVSIYEAALGADHPHVAVPLSLLAEALIEQDRPAEAIAAAERTLTLFAPGETVLWTHDALARYVLARALVQTDGDRTRATTLATEAATLYDTADEPAFSRADEVRSWLESHPG